MYAKFFGLQQEPFSIAPDPRYLFMSERHRDALAHLLYGLHGGGGFVLLTGEIGAGKTTVCRCFLEQIPQGCNVAYIFNPKLTVHELLKTICEEFHVKHEHPAGEAQTVKQYIDPLNEFLLRTHAQGQSNVLIIDEAQNLSAEVLEQLRLLTNLETNERKLLQIVLIGQPELRAMLARPELEQLAQRVIARFHLEALSEAETAQYIEHRLGVAGFSGPMPFDRKASRRIHQLTRGVPRRINLLCDRALLAAYALGRHDVERKTLDRAAAEVFEGGIHSAAQRRWIWPLAAAGLLGAAGVAAVTATRGTHEAGPMPPAITAAASAPVAASAPAVGASAPVAVSDGPVVALRSEAEAWRALGAAWHLDWPANDQPCQAWRALDQPVLCFKSSEGGLALLRQLGRPAVLTLHDEAGQLSYVTLVGLGDGHASLRAGEQTQTVSLLALSKLWRGEFVTLWRSPPGYQQGRAAVSAELSGWLDQQLLAVFKEKPAGTQAPDAAALQARVATFQRSQGLRSDGVAGPVTLMHLSRAARAFDEPRLPSELPPK
ncbi:AAA family ATPase [Paucibacter sp. JuS9]|uniref:AAA family ATPase n=1 Tax=Paucibacter sp. JuS9 TaxID=3228748 RepID=UPI0037571010